MNISDFERLLREGNTPQHFPPEEDGWLLLEQDLERKRRGGIIVLPKRMYLAAAASIALLVSIGFYALRQVPAERVVDVAGSSQPRVPNTGPAAMLQDTAHTSIEPEITLPAVRQRSSGSAVVMSGARKQEAVQTHPVPADSVVVTNLPKQNGKYEPMEQKKVLPPENKGSWPDNGSNQYARGEVPGLNFGFSAFYGFSGIAKAQYRVSLHVKRNLSKKVFANVQVVGSTAKLSSSNLYHYEVVSLGPVGAAPIITIQEIEAAYSGNVYNLGLTPSIGFRITKNFSVSAGPDVQKSLTRSVTLTNKDDFRNQINNGILIDERQEIADLDVGLQSTAQVSISSRLSANLLYRYGFTDYLKKNAGGTRNSFMCIGLSYNIK